MCGCHGGTSAQIDLGVDRLILWAIRLHLRHLLRVAIHLAEGRFLTMKRRILGGDTLLLGMERTRQRRTRRSIERIDGRGISRQPRLGRDALDQVTSRLTVNIIIGDGIIHLHGELFIHVEASRVDTSLSFGAHGILASSSSATSSATLTTTAATTLAASTWALAAAARNPGLELGIDVLRRHGENGRIAIMVRVRIPGIWSSCVVIFGRFHWGSRVGCTSSGRGNRLGTIPARGAYGPWLVWLSPLLLLLGLPSITGLPSSITRQIIISGSHAGITRIVINITGFRLTAPLPHGQEEHGSIVRLRIDHGGQYLVRIPPIIVVVFIVGVLSMG